MSEKINTLEIDQVGDQINRIAQGLGVTLMATAAVLGLVEPSHNFGAATVAQSANVVITEDPGQQDHSQRREKEEHGPHYSTKSISQRTPGRTGKA